MHLPIAAPVAPPAPRPREKVDVDSVFKLPGRRIRPDKVCVILRGLPGSGKSHVTRLLRDLENVSYMGNVLFRLLLGVVVLVGDHGDVSFAYFSGSPSRFFR